MGLTVAELVATLGLDDQGFGNGLDGLMGKFAPLEAGAVAAAAAIAAAFVGATIALVHLGDQFEDAFNNIRTSTGATGEALAGLEDDFKAVYTKTPAGMEDVSAAVSELNQRLGLTGRPLQALSLEFIRLARITKSDVSETIRDGTRLFGDWNVAAKDQAGTLDVLYRATQHSGIGVTDLMSTVTQFGAPMRALGFSLTDSVAMLAKWEKEGVNTSSVLAAMKIGLGKLSETADDPKKALSELIDKIHDAGSVGKAVDLAKDVFGSRGAAYLVDAIRSGKIGYEEFERAIAHGGDTIAKSAKDISTWKSKLTLLGHEAQVALEPLASALVGGLADGLGAVDKALKSDRAKGIFGGISDAFGVAEDKLAAAWRAIAPIVMPVLREWVQTTQIYMHRLWPIVSAVFRAIVQVVRWAWPVVKDIILGALNVIAGVMRLVMALMRGDWSGAWKAIQQIVKGASRVVEAVIHGLAASAKAILSAAWSALKALTAAAWNGIVSAVQSNVGRVVSFVASLPGRIVSAIGSLGSLLYNAGASLIQGLISGIEDRLSELWSKVSSIAGKIKSLKGPLDYDAVLLRPAGQAIMAGLVQGIGEGQRGLERKLAEVTRSITVQPSLRVDSGLALAGAGSGGSAGVAVVHEHYHVHVPGGSVLVGTLDEAARILSPHVTRHQERVSAMKGVGR